MIARRLSICASPVLHAQGFGPMHDAMLGDDLEPLSDGFLGDLIAYGIDQEEMREPQEEREPWEEQAKSLFGGDEEDD